MEMTFEQDLWHQPVAMLPRSGMDAADAHTPDWHALAARLAAAHAYWRVAGCRVAPVVGGSFHPAAARRISAYGQAIDDVCEAGAGSPVQNLRFVNLVNSAVRKYADAKAISVAGSHLSGDRGLI